MKDIFLKFINNGKFPDCNNCYFTEACCNNQCGDTGHFEREKKEIQTEYEWKKQRLKDIKSFKFSRQKHLVREVNMLEVWLEENKPEQWELVTVENVKVGDVIRERYDDHRERIVEHIDRHNPKFTLYDKKYEQTIYNADFEYYEINIYKESGIS